MGGNIKLGRQACEATPPRAQCGLLSSFREIFLRNGNERTESLLSSGTVLVKMARRIRQVWDAIGVQMKSFFTPQPGVCIQCHKALDQGEIHCAHLPKEDVELEFCSQYCAFNYWADFKRHCQTTAGVSVCSFPGCSKPCYQEGYKIHNYCGRSHAKEHKSMMDAMERDRKKHRRGGGASGYGTSAGSPRSYKRNGPIKFYNRGEPYYEFTNFHEVMIEIDEKHWPTTEHYFQSQKFVGTPILETMRMLSRPREAFDLSRDPRYSRWRRPDWEEVKEKVMYKALQAKFSQHKELRQLLLETGERELIEHSPYDSYWGDGGDGTGKNRLGKLLMKLRDEMNSKKKCDLSSSPHASARQFGASDKGRSSPEFNQSPVHGLSYRKFSPEHGDVWPQQHSPMHQQHGRSQLPLDPQTLHPALHTTGGGMPAQASLPSERGQSAPYQSQYYPREDNGHGKPKETTV